MHTETTVPSNSPSFCVPKGTKFAWEWDRLQNPGMQQEMGQVSLSKSSQQTSNNSMVLPAVGVLTPRVGGDATHSSTSQIVRKGYASWSQKLPLKLTAILSGIKRVLSFFLLFIFFWVLSFLYMAALQTSEGKDHSLTMTFCSGWRALFPQLPGAAPTLSLQRCPWMVHKTPRETDM